MQLDEHTASELGYTSSVKVVTVEPGGLTTGEEHSNKIRLLLVSLLSSISALTCLASAWR